jgi:hypothetical protein
VCGKIIPSCTAEIIVLYWMKVCGERARKEDATRANIHHHAMISDFYSPGDHKIIYGKNLIS